MYWTTSQATTLLGSDFDPSQLLTGGLPTVGVTIPAGSLVQSADPPNTVAGFLQVTWGGQSGWVNQADLTQGVLSSNVAKLGIGVSAVALAWYFFFRR